MKQVTETVITTRLFWFFAAVCAAFLFLYGYFLQKTVFELVEQKHAALETAHLARDVSALEARYAALQAGVTRSHAESLGLVAPSSVLFADRTTARALSLRADGF